MRANDGSSVKNESPPVRSSPSKPPLQSETYLRSIVGNSPECIKVVDANGTLLDMNPAGLKMVEAENAEEVLGKNIYGIIAPEYRDAFRAMNERVCGGKKETLEFEILGLKGTRRQMETTAVPIPSPNGTGYAQLAVTRDVTARKQIENALRQSRAAEETRRIELETLMEAVPAIVWVAHDPECQRITGNREGYKFLRQSPGSNLSVTAPPGERPDQFQVLKNGQPLPHAELPMQKVGRTGQALFGEELEERFSDGTRRWLYGNIVPLPKADRSVAGVLATFLDITERKEAEEALRQSELRFRTMAEALPNLVWTDRADGQCDWLSDQWRRYTGIPERELLGLKWLERVIHPDDRERTLACWHAACKDRGEYDLEYRIRRHDGAYRWFKTRGVPVRNGDGKIIYWFGTCTDIQDLKEAEQRERSLIEQSLTATAKFKAVFNQSGIFQGIMDVEGNLREVNDLAVDYCGYRREEVLDRPFWEIPCWRGSEEVKARIRLATQQAAAGKVFRETLPYWTAEGTRRLVDFAMHPIRDDAGLVRFLHPSGIDVTEQRRIQEALELSEERFRLAAFSDAITLYEQDAELRYTWLYPLHPEHTQSIGKGDLELLPGEEGEALAKWKREVMATGQPQRREVRTTLAMGAKVYDVFVVPKRNAGGQIVGVAGTALDITRRKEVEQTLREIEERFRSILDNSPTVIFIKDTEGRYLQVNRWHERLFHVTQEEVVGKTDFDIFPPEIAQKFRENDLRVLSTGQPLEIEEIAPHDDGPHTYISIKFPLRREDGTIYGITGISTDITERKRNEIAAQRLAAIVEHSDDAIVSKDLNGIVSSWNKGAERLFGYRAEEMIGKSITILLPPELVNQEAEILERVRSERVAHYETVRRRKDGSLINISLTVSPVRDSTGRVIGASKVARDITDKVRAQEKLERTVAARTASLREAIAQMEEFSYSVSHDLRSPVRAMQGYARALIEDYGNRLDDEGREYLDRIVQGSARMERLIHDVLTYSRVSRMDMELQPISLDSLVRGIIRQYPEFESSRADIIVHPALPEVLGHEPSLGQAVANVLSNAVKFVAPGVRPQVRILARCNNGMVELRIEDNGIGIKPEHQRRLFGMFERIHPDAKYEGTGIGLAIVRKAVERMGGRVGVESDGTHGSSFWIQLPAA